LDILTETESNIGKIKRDKMKKSCEPIGHHTVPRCYLKHFNTKIIYKRGKDKYFVDAYDKKGEKKECYLRDIDGICKINEFYTFSKLPDDERLCLEKLFSTSIERDYGFIYPFLINGKHKQVSNNLKESLISFVITQFFRTSVLTNVFVTIAEDIVKTGRRLSNPETGINKIQTFNGNNFDYSKQSIDEIIKEEKNSAKENINIVKFQMALDLFKLRKKDIVSISKVHPSHFLITSDTPVFSTGMFLDINTIIKMPINHEYLLSILPRTKFPPFNPKEIIRFDMDEQFSYIESTLNNSNQISNSERFIIGKEENIKEALLHHSQSDFNDINMKAKKFTEDMVLLGKDLGYDLGL